MRKQLRFIGLMIALFAVFQTTQAASLNFSAILPGNATTTANTTSYIKLDGAKLKTKIATLPFTVEMAFKPTAFNAYGGLWSDRSAGTATTIQYNNTTNSIRVDYAGTTVLLPASAVTTLNAWNHLALVVTSNSVKLVLNGVTYQRTGMTNTVVPFSGRSYVGLDSASTSTLNRTVTGQFDEIRFWNTARTDAEISSNKFKSLSGTETGLVAYYNFNGQNTSDVTANAINAFQPTIALTFNNVSSDATIISSADLSAINLSQGVLGADFAAATATYTAYVPPTSTNTVDVVGNTVGYQPPVSQTVDLTQASPSAVLNVTSSDATTTKAYTVNITKTDLNTYWSGNGIATASVRSYPNLWGWKCSDTDNCWSLANSSGTAIRYNDVLLSANTWWATTPTTAWGGRVLYLRWDGSGNTTANSVFSYPVAVEAGKAYTFTYKYAWANNGAQPVFTHGFGTDQSGISVIASDTALASAKKQYLKSKSLTFTAPTTGTYFLTIKSTGAALCGVADLTFAQDNTTQSITTTATTLSFDNLNLTRTFVVGGANLTTDITLTAPTGITLSKTTITPAEAQAGVTVTATYDNATLVYGGLISLTNGTITKTIVANGSNDYACFTSTYPGVPNLITDYYLNSLSTYGGWGTKSIVTDPTKAFCGLSCASVGNGTAKNTGSMDFTLTGKMLANTKYRVHAMAKTVSGSFEFGVGGCGVNGVTTDFNTTFDTGGAWQAVDVYFTTGTLAATQGLYFNNANTCTGFTGYIDNYELCAVPKVYTSSSAALTFLGTGAKKVAVRAVNLSSSITITAPASFTVSTASMPSTVSGSTADSLTVTFNGPNSASGYIYFTSGSVKDSLQVTGTVAPTLMASATYLSLDERLNTGSFTVTGGNLLTDVTMTAPTGITLTPATLPSTANAATVTVTYDGNAVSTGYITLTSGAATQRIRVKAVRNADTFTPLFSTGNLVANPYMDALTGFGGWGSNSISADTAVVYSGSKCALTSGKCGGSIDYNLTSFLLANSNYRVKAMVNTNGTGTFKIGVSGIGVANVLNEVSTAAGEWKAVDFTFATGATLTSPNMYFNSCESQTGTTGYIDNWEMYFVSPVTDVTNVGLATEKAYVQNGKIVADFNLSLSGAVEFSVYNTQGMLLSKEQRNFNSGANHAVLNANLGSGVYIVRIAQNAKVFTQKVIK